MSSPKSKVVAVRVVGPARAVCTAVRFAAGRAWLYTVVQGQPVAGDGSPDGAPSEPAAYPHLAPALTRPIRWELIAQQYDQMIKYATAIRTASTEAILRRFTRNASHPTYAAMLELGRAQKTIFVCRYIRVRDLQREIEEGLNVMESSNRANSVIAYGGAGQIASNRRDEQEMFVACLRILQAALVYVNTLMLQDVLAEPAWGEASTPDDQRGLTPLFWTHVLPYGEVKVALPDGDSEAMAAGLSLIGAHLDGAERGASAVGSGGEVLGQGRIKTVVQASGTPATRPN